MRINWKYERLLLLAVLPAVALVGCLQSGVPISDKRPEKQIVSVSTPQTKDVPEKSPELEKPKGPEDITWERLDIGMEPDSVFQPWMLTTSIKVLEGKPVRIKGWMNGAVFQRSNIRNFFLMREKECPFGPGGQAHHAIEVELEGKLRTDFTLDEITVEGIFNVVPMKGENGNTWSLYRISGTAVK
jgi:hypothetical protein